MVDEKYVEWKVKDADYYFKKITDTLWFEYHSGEKAFEFEFLYQKDSEVCLSKIESVMFIKLGPKELTFGETKNRIDKHLCYGSWVNKFQGENNSCDNNFSLWKASDKELYFKKVSNTRWFEFENGKHVFEFEFLSRKGNEVYLSKVGYLMHLKLSPRDIYYGESQDQIDKHLCDGNWISSEKFPLDILCCLNENEENEFENQSELNKELWKVDGEDRFYKQVSNKSWIELVDGEPVFEFIILKKTRNSVYLRKKGGFHMYLKLAPNEIIYGESEKHLNKHLYNGKWVSNSNKSHTSSIYMYFKDVKFLKLN